MTRAEDLLQALNGIKKAADNELSGEAHEEALLYVEELFRLAGFDGEDGGDGEANRRWRLPMRLRRFGRRPTGSFPAVRSISHRRCSTTS